jgi:hypothetical protein
MNKIKDAFSKIQASDEFKIKLYKNLQPSPIKSANKKLYYKPVIAVATILLLLMGIASFKIAMNNHGNESVNTVSIPKIELPKGDGGVRGKMIPLILYKGNIYTLSATTIDPEKGKNLLGEKLGITKGNLNEWSTQKDYSKEFASTIGKQDIFSVKNYDKNFRIMTNTINQDGTNYVQFYDCLNGITIKNGSDFFEKLKLKGNISDGEFRLFSDWNSGLETFYKIKDINLLNKFVNVLDKSIPYLQETMESTLGDYQNDEQYREITLNLKDGSKVTFSFLKSGYVYYGSKNIYFKVDTKISESLWKELSIPQTSK